MESLDDPFIRYMEKGRRRHWIYSPSIGQSGGIILSWDPANISQLVYSINRYSINVSFDDATLGTTSLLTVVHMPCDRQEKAATRDELKLWFEHQHCRSWIIAGDFNATLDASERSGCVGDCIDSEAFRNWIDSLSVEHKNVSQIGH